MSISNLIALPDLVIPIGTDVSNVLNGKLLYEDAYGITIYSPTVLDALDFQIHVSYDGAALTYNVGTFVPWEADTPGDGVLVPSAGFAKPYIELPLFGAFAILSSGNVAATRTFKVFKSWGAR